MPLATPGEPVMLDAAHRLPRVPLGLLHAQDLEAATRRVVSHTAGTLRIDLLAATCLQTAWRATMARRRDDREPMADAFCPPAALKSKTVLQRDAPAVIFLDIDGVICTSSKGTALIRDVLLENLKLIVNACKPPAKVVLSTDWRRITRRKELAERKLAERGIECIGATPYAGQDANVRPREIAAWLRDDNRNITRWVAIDDRLLTDEDGGDFLVGHCVTTEFATGLTEERADEAIQLLQRQ